MQILIVRRIHGKNQIDPNKPVAGYLPRDVVNLVAVAHKHVDCSSICLTPDMPVAGSCGIHLNQLRETGTLDAIRQDDLGYRGSADIPKADRSYPIRPGSANCRWFGHA